MQDGMNDPLELTAERREPARRAGPSRLWFALVALAIAAGAIWYAFEQTNRVGEEGVAPLIKAEEGPTRVKPDDPGGMEIPHQDKAVYEKLGNDTPAPQKAESLLPPPEEPMPPPEPAPAAAAPEPSQAINVINTAGESPAPPPADAETTTTAAKEMQPPESEVPAAEEPAPEETAKAAEVAPAAGTPETQMAAKPPAPAAAGAYRVQLSSMRSAADADAAWAKLQKTYPDLLGNLSLNVEKVDLEGKGTFYRVQAGQLSEQAAKDLCAELKRRKADCLVVKS